MLLGINSINWGSLSEKYTGLDAIEEEVLEDLLERCEQPDDPPNRPNEPDKPGLPWVVNIILSLCKHSCFC